MAGGWIAFLARRAGVRRNLDRRPASRSHSPSARSRWRRSCCRPDPDVADAPIAALPAWDLPARAIATALLVLGLTGAAAGLGPTLTGVLTPFPVSNTVLAAFLLVLEGPAQLDAFFRGFLRGAYGFCAFCFLVAVLSCRWAWRRAFVLALLGALTAQAVVRLLAGGLAAPPSAPLRGAPSPLTGSARGVHDRAPRFDGVGFEVRQSPFDLAGARQHGGLRAGEVAGELALGQHADRDYTG